MKTLRIFLAVLFLGFSGIAQAEVISASELIANAVRYDGKKVIYRGEAVGELMRRGDYAWISLNDGANSLGVWVPAEKLEFLNYFGGYQIKGDVIEVTGIFHQSCPEHGGDLDIHAEEMKLVSRGEKVILPLDREKIRLSFYLALAAFLLLAIYLIRASQKRRP